MDIPTLSIQLSNMKLQTDWGVAMLANSLDTSESVGNKMVEMLDSQRIMEQSVHPYLGSNFDVSL